MVARLPRSLARSCRSWKPPRDLNPPPDDAVLEQAPGLPRLNTWGAGLGGEQTGKLPDQPGRL
jgi:hypothetical protein